MLERQMVVPSASPRSEKNDPSVVQRSGTPKHGGPVDRPHGGTVLPLTGTARLVPVATSMIMRTPYLSYRMDLASGDHTGSDNPLELDPSSAASKRRS